MQLSLNNSATFFSTFANCPLVYHPLVVVRSSLRFVHEDERLTLWWAIFGTSAGLTRLNNAKNSGNRWCEIETLLVQLFSEAPISLYHYFIYTLHIFNRYLLIKAHQSG
uniref:Uncharacterized protein n=1 Tax=Parascaris univalens TaxID=6257 RepID=A0A915A5E1_PARUN